MSGVTGAVIVGAATVAGAVITSQAAKSAASAQAAGYNSATAEQQRQYDQTRADYAPYREAGYGALGTINKLNAGDYSSFTASPDYNFTRTEGQRGIEQSAAARGGAFSGNALRALSDYNQGLASQQYGAYYNRLAGVAGVGQSATGSTAAAGQNTANQISNNLIGAGDARASGIVGAGNAWGNAFGTIANAGLYGWKKGLGSGWGLTG
jgi:hypothetical protein